MTNTKPYRLISDAELCGIQTAFEMRLAAWNDTHALFPLKCTLHRSDLSEPRPLGSVTEITDENGPAALLIEDDYITLKHAVFGDASDCFNPVSETLLLTLLTQLLGKQSIHLESGVQNPTMNDWHYLGSPSLTLTLSHMTLYLHPQWVLSALPPCPLTLGPITRLNDALRSISLDLQIELNPIPLHLKDMMGLQVGDVIKTEHRITTPVVLSHQQHTVCHASIGETESYKSIQITRAS